MNPDCQPSTPRHTISKENGKKDNESYFKRTENQEKDPKTEKKIGVKLQSQNKQISQPNNELLQQNAVSVVG